MPSVIPTLPPTEVPIGFEDMVAPMRVAHDAILQRLVAAGYDLPLFPAHLPRGNPRGMAAARAYPIQGILKYHGMADWTWRTAFLPSISLNNDAAETITLVEFAPELTADEASIGGQQVGGRALARIVRILDAVRALGGVTSRARVTSRNIVRASKVGKGLGTSASASAALARATLDAVLGEEAANNSRLLSVIARLLAGSGCRSAVGGIGLWLSYPGIPHEESFAVRLDRGNSLSDVRLITLPIDSRVGLHTEQAHKDAPHSIFFRPWMASRLADTLTCMDAIESGDWRTWAQLAEVDSIRLHGITMSGGGEHKLFAWEPENITLFRMCNDLRAAGAPVYFSTDTGPTTVLITHRSHVGAVVKALSALELDIEWVVSQIAGPAESLDIHAAAELLAMGASIESIAVGD